ncbi:MAG: ion transporter [Lachnospiraceae bacterium]|nr:ion transporter [Lachnospiraceae bacterium]
MKKSRIKRRTFDIIQIGNREDTPSRVFDYFIVAVILTNILVMFLTTFDFPDAVMNVLHVLEYVTVGVFLVEYILRIWTAPYLYPQEKRWKARLKFLLSYDGIVDLLTILPFFFLSGFVVFRMLRVVRIFHLFRINAHYDSFMVIKSVLYEKRNQLITSLFILLVLILASSICMYSAEHEVQPEVFKNALSGIWWSVSALLTVGYGDVTPVTVLGRAMAIVISFLGVMAVAIPTGIISAGFVENYQEVTRESVRSQFELKTVTVDIDSKWNGKTVKEAEQESGVEIVLVRQNGSSFKPDDGYRIALGDELAVLQ